MYRLLTKLLLAGRNAAALAVLGVSLASAGSGPAGPPEVKMLPDAAAAPDQVVQLQRDGVIPGQYIVVFHDDVADPRGLGNALAAQHGFALRHSYGFALKGFAARMPDTVAQALADDPDVAFVEPDIFAHAIAQTLPTGVDRIDAELNLTANIDGIDDRVDVDIAIIDTGIDLDHPDLNVHKAVDCTKGPSCEKGGSGNDGNGHGTHVAGSAAALDNGIGVVGVAPGARLWGVKVLGDSGSGSFADVIAGIDYVTAHAGEIEVANMSLGGQGSLASLRMALQNSVAAGVVYVVAAGNSSKDVYGNDGIFATNDDPIPASYPEVATISALSDTDGQPGGWGALSSWHDYCNGSDCNGDGIDDGADDSFAWFSNHSGSVEPGNPVSSPGGAIDLLMPGVDILSTWRDGTYETISGTSMAAPHATGLAALYIAEYGRATNAAGVYAIRQALIDGGVAQGSAAGLWIPNDPDNTRRENIGWAGNGGGPVGAPPTVSITSPDDGSTFDGGPVSMTGTAADADDGPSLPPVAWSSSIDGDIGSGDSISPALSDGEHGILASVTDLDGNTANAFITVTVGAPAPDPGIATVDSIAYALSGGRKGDKNLSITITAVDDIGDPVSGATVSILLRHDNGRAWSGTGSTTGDGTVKFMLNNAQSGCYTTTVTSLTADGLDWDGATPENEGCK